MLQNRRRWMCQCTAYALGLCGTVSTSLLAQSHRHNSLSLSSANLKRAAQYSKQTQGLSLMIGKSGKLLLEEYHLPVIKPNTVIDLRSIAKNLTALAIFKAIEEGMMSWDEKACDTLPEWITHHHKNKITIRHLLTMTSGLPGASWLYRSSVTSVSQRALELEPLSSPGLIFDYGPSHVEILGEILRRKLREKKSFFRSSVSPVEYLQGKILHPMGIQSLVCQQDRSGQPYYSARMGLNTRDLFALGHLICEPKRILKESTLRQAASGTRPNPCYGGTFWLNQGAARGHHGRSMESLIGLSPGHVQWHHCCLAPHAPASMITFLGSNGQRVYMIPSEQLVIVRTGKGAAFQDETFWRFLTNRA